MNDYIGEDTGMTHHTITTGCNLTQQDFHPEGDEPCIDGGKACEHPNA